jgi:hypothetical protein
MYKHRNIQTVDVATAGTEKSIELPKDTVAYFLQSRDQVVLKLAYNSGDIGSGDYISIFPNGWNNDVPYYTNENRKDEIFFTSTKDGDTVEILTISA